MEHRGGASREGGGGELIIMLDEDDLCGVGVSQRYVKQGREALRSRSKLASALISSKRLPEKGWDDASIEALLAELAAMDSNNFLGNAGVGEREGRVFSGIVHRRHFRMAHGMGRSGEVAAEQPKAAGSSIAVSLANILMKDALREAGVLPKGMEVLLLPLATGMSMTITLLALRALKPNAKYVLFPRVDQKTCLKVAMSCGYELVVIENDIVGDQVITDIEALQMKIEQLGAENIACVLATTSCFAPRAVDDIVSISQLCHRCEVPCIINNAYGVQARMISSRIQDACRKGRVDAIVQSTDKNFMVPVGGAAIVAHSDFLVKISKTYPGRASITPVLDVLITLLGMGREGWKRCLHEREELYIYLRDSLQRVADEEGERLLETQDNPISMAITLSTIDDAKEEITFFGSMLFSRQVSGTRAVSCKDEANIAGQKLKGFGAHHNEYPVPYLAAAAAIGASTKDAELFIRRLRACFKDYRKRKLRKV